jgi:hypothetical protein
MMCIACEEGRHHDCNLAVWCECECAPESCACVECLGDCVAGDFDEDMHEDDEDLDPESELAG